MRAIDMFLRQLDDAWRHRWESLMPVLDGVTEQEAAWQAPCYRSEPASAPPAGTILWQVDHLTRCKRAYTGALHGRSPEPHEAARTFAEALERLEDAHRVQRETIASLAEADLDRQVEDGMTVAEFLTSTIRHDTWHAAQIAVARRLWRTRDPVAG
jgi:uncharacterized damage-inducible protein DinB